MTSRTGRIHRFLRSADSVSATSQTLAAGLLLAGLTLVNSVFLARFLGPEGRGLVAAVLLWPPLLQAFGLLGLNNAFVYFTRREPGSEASLLKLGAFLVVVASFASALLALLFVKELLFDADDRLRSLATVFLLIVTPLTALTTLIGAVAQAKGDFFAFNLSRLLQPAFLLLGLVVTQVLEGLTPFSAVAAALASAVAACGGTALIILRAPAGHRAPAAMGLQKRFVLYGTAVAGVEILGALSTHVDRLAIVGTLTARDLGIYTVAYGLARIAGQLHSAASSVLFPKAAGAGLEEVLEKTGRGVRLTTMAALIAAVPLILASTVLIDVLFGSAFSDSALLFRILVIEALVQGTSWMMAQAFNALGKPHLIIVRQVFGLAATIALMVALAPLMGAIVRLAVTLGAFRVALHCPVPPLLPRSSDIRYLRDRLASLMA